MTEEKTFRWSAEEDQFLIKNSQTLSNNQIAKTLNRSVIAVRKRRIRLNIPNSISWTDTEITFLKNNFNSVPLVDIALILNRSYPSVKKKIYILEGSSAFESPKELIDTTTLANFLGLSRSRIAALIRTKNLPAQPIKQGTDKYRYFIPLNSFFSWFKNNHKNLCVNFNKINTSALESVEIPSWILKEISKKTSYSKIAIWTEEEDAFILKFHKVMSDTEIAKELGKTYSEVKRRRLKLGEHLTKRWTEEELNFIKNNADTYKASTLARKLHRTEAAVTKKLGEIFGTESFLNISGLLPTTYFANLLGCTSGKISYWIKNKGLPATKIRLKKLQKNVNHKQLFSYGIDIDTFFIWFRSNYKNLDVDFKKVNLDYCIHPPEWFSKEYLAGNSYGRNKLWDFEEEALLYKFLSKTDLTYIEIATRLNRSKQSVSRKSANLIKKIQTDEGYRKKIMNFTWDNNLT